jgi:hypothetical protein
VENETYEIRRGTIVYKSRPPLDVRIVPGFCFLVALGQVPLGILFLSGVTKLAGTYRVLFGAVVVASEKAAGVYALFVGICWLFCAWGLHRRMKFSWWFATIFSAYYLTDEALQFARSPRDFVIGAIIQISLIAWLWFRREFYGIRLAANHIEK